MFDWITKPYIEWTFMDSLICAGELIILITIVITILISITIIHDWVKDRKRKEKKKNDKSRKN